MKVAVWYMQYGAADVEVCDDERQAVDFALVMAEAGMGAISGFQLEDGTLIDRSDFDNWPPMVEAREIREAAEQAEREAWAARPKPELRDVTSPFQLERTGMGQVYVTKVPVDTPSWVGA